MKLLLIVIFSLPSVLTQAQVFTEPLTLCPGNTIIFSASQDPQKKDYILETRDGAHITRETIKMPDLDERMLRNEYKELLQKKYSTLLAKCAPPADESLVIQFIESFSTDAAAIIKSKPDTPQTVLIDKDHFLRLSTTPAGEYLISEITTAPRNARRDILKISYTTPSVQLITANIASDPPLQSHLDSLSSLLDRIKFNFKPGLYLIPGVKLTDSAKLILYLEETANDMTTPIIPPDLYLKFFGAKLSLSLASKPNIDAYTIQKH